MSREDQLRPVAGLIVRLSLTIFSSALGTEDSAGMSRYSYLAASVLARMNKYGGITDRLQQK